MISISIESTSTSSKFAPSFQKQFYDSINHNIRMYFFFIYIYIHHISLISALTQIYKNI